MYWKRPHISKIYEALTAIADSRIELDGFNRAKCYSSSGNKYYEVKYDSKSDSIMSNDNTAYYTGSISYPMIALLMLKGRIKYNQELLPNLIGIRWKDVNQKFNNDYDKAVEYVLAGLESKGTDVKPVRDEIERMYSIIEKLKLEYLGQKRKPPLAY